MPELVIDLKCLYIWHIVKWNLNKKNFNFSVVSKNKYIYTFQSSKMKSFLPTCYYFFSLSLSLLFGSGMELFFEVKTKVMHKRHDILFWLILWNFCIHHFNWENIQNFTRYLIMDNKSDTSTYIDDQLSTAMILSFLGASILRSCKQIMLWHFCIDKWSSS